MDFMHSIKLRPSTFLDSAFVDDLTRQVMFPYVSETWSSLEEIESYFVKNKFGLQSTQIIQLNEIDVGRLSLSILEDAVFIDNIHILPEYQGKGIGSSVISRVFEDADVRGLPVKLHLLRKNPVKSLYERLGFKVIEENEYRFFMLREPVSCL